MFLTLLMLLTCALIAIASVPLILKLVPPNPIYGVRTRRALENPDIWFRINQFGGWALIAAAGVTAILLMLYSGTWLNSFWAQVAALVIPIAIAVGVTLWFERKL